MRTIGMSVAMRTIGMSDYTVGEECFTELPAALAE